MQSSLPNLDYIINANNFQKIQDCLSEASDMAMVTVDYQGMPVTRHSHCSGYCALVRSNPELFDLCRRCDSRGGLEAARVAKPYIYRCHMDLLDFAVPIVVEGSYIGAILAGQVILKDEDERSGLEKIVDARPSFRDGDLLEKLEAHRALLPVMTRDRVQVIANMMFQITNYIIEEALVKINLSENWEPRPAAFAPAASSPVSSGHARPMYDNLILNPAFEYIRHNFGQRIVLDDMASLCNISSSYFSKLFNKVTGDSFSNYVNRVRVERACELLSLTDTPITVIAFDLGFEDSSYFNKVFKRITGVTPSSYKIEHCQKVQS